MKPLVAKEIRLLLPAYGMALLLALSPVLLPVGRDDNALALMISLFAFGVVMLALSSFGREFSLRTFPMILSQPMERRRMWWTKIVVLVAAMATSFGAWSLSCLRWFNPHPYGPGMLEILAMGGTIVVVAISGALWTTMLLRQVMAAFWFTVLIPAAIMMLIEFNHGTARATYIAMGIYSAAGFALAWWQFNRAQETAWTGGVITLPGWGTAEAAGRLSKRHPRPFAALFWKELQLQQMGLLGMAGLFLLHLGVIWLRKVGHFEIGDQTRVALEVFGGIWFSVPLVSASVSVAEERKLGTMQEILCLPVSRRVQFWTKFVLSLAVSGILSAVLLWMAEGIGGRIGAGSFFGVAKGAPFEWWILVLISLVFLMLALAGFYASTLTNGLIQALAVAVATVTVFFGINALSAMRWTIHGYPLWRGFLIFYISWPVLIITVVWLAWRNFRSVSGAWMLWRRNLTALAVALAFIVTVTTAIYNRVWEFVANPEPLHSQARLKGSQPSSLSFFNFGQRLTALLPDGRLWLGSIGYDQGRLLLQLGGKDTGRNDGNTAIFAAGTWHGSKADHFATGSNWVGVSATTFGETAGIREDGTLWVFKHFNRDADLNRFGNETDWRKMAANYMGVLFLKQDGTLWHMGQDYFARGRTEQRDSGMRRFGKDSDWAEIRSLPNFYGCYAWKKNGEAWIIHPPQVMVMRNPDEVEIEPGGLLMDRLPDLDNTRWHSITGYYYGNVQLGVRADGTLWHWNVNNLVEHEQKHPWNNPARNNKVVQLGTDTNWMAVAGWFGNIGLLKTDGTFWMWNLSSWGIEGPIDPPVQMSRNNDWIALAYSMDGFVTLAADGSVWHWWDQSDRQEQSLLPLPRPSRRPSRIENILDKE